MLVVRNGITHLEKCLNSLLKQTYPKEFTEIIIVDGLSTDGTRELLEDWVEQLSHKNVDIRLLDNPKLILSSGWNMGLRNSSGDIVCRIDVHSEICPHYVEIGVDQLLRHESDKIVCVGGVLENVGSGFIGRTIADLFGSRFGVGNSAFRTKINQSKFTDTAVFGLYYKWIFDEVGYFDENLERNQDIALHSKILERGYKFITYPDLKIKYHVRKTITGLIKKAFGDGYWIIASKKSYLRHKIPFYFILYLLSIPVVFGIFKSFHKLTSLYLLLLALYIILSIYFSIKHGKSHAKFLLPILFPIFHISYGLGSLKGIMNIFTFKKGPR